ncbi:MAG TPA: Sir2 family NAD-dependent protein deacetylase, partial [Thermomicrobiales bacterium]|nr:Sir2 family NAD-dependent protein deacetylase [Thermomicrobiales bacterium]
MADRANTGNEFQAPNPELVEAIADRILASDRMVAFTGAGISTESGIPDYRGPNGVWQTGQIPSVDTIRTDDEARREFWQRRRETYPVMQARQPNAGHLALAELEAAGKLLAIITQ